MKALTSRDNPLFKRLKALAGSAQQQRKQGRALLEEVHLAQAYFETVGQPERCVVTEAARTHEEARALLERIDDARTLLLPETLFKQVSTLAHGTGLLFLVPTPAPSLPSRVARDCVILDGVQDAGNVGSILHSAAAAGVTDVFCMTGTAAAWSAKVLRAGMGAHFRLRIYEQAAPQALAERLQATVALTDSHAPRALFECDLRPALAWVFGMEGAGVSAFWRQAANLRVTIPQPGGMESLNVAAAAVCLFEQVRQRTAGERRGVTEAK